MVLSFVYGHWLSNYKLYNLPHLFFSFFFSSDSICCCPSFSQIVISFPIWSQFVATPPVILLIFSTFFDSICCRSSLQPTPSEAAPTECKEALLLTTSPFADATSVWSTACRSPRSTEHPDTHALCAAKSKFMVACILSPLFVFARSSRVHFNHSRVPICRAKESRLRCGRRGTPVLPPRAPTSKATPAQCRRT